jgi:hypothetical protein
MAAERLAEVIDLHSYARYRSLDAVRWAREARPNLPTPTALPAQAIEEEREEAMPTSPRGLVHFRRSDPDQPWRVSHCGAARGFTSSPIRITCSKCLRSLSAEILAARSSGKTTPWSVEIGDAVVAKARRIGRRIASRRWARKAQRQVTR